MVLRTSTGRAPRDYRRYRQRALLPVRGDASDASTIGVDREVGGGMTIHLPAENDACNVAPLVGLFHVNRGRRPSVW